MPDDDPKPQDEFSIDALPARLRDEEAIRYFLVAWERLSSKAGQLVDTLAEEDPDDYIVPKYKDIHAGSQHPLIGYLNIGSESYSVLKISSDDLQKGIRTEDDIPKWLVTDPVRSALSIPFKITDTMFDAYDMDRMNGLIQASNYLRSVLERCPFDFEIIEPPPWAH